MAYTLSTETTIPRTPDQVWAVLTDFSSYSKWNPFVKNLTGKVSVGERIRVDLPGMTFRPKVLVFKPSEEFRWLGNTFFKGVFDGEHFFRLTAKENGHTLLEHGEHFSGVLLWVFKASGMLEKTRTGFQKMNDALKERCITLFP